MSEKTSMRKYLRAENVIMLTFFLYLVYTHPIFSWYIVLWFWLPDIAFIGYAFNKNIGAVCYNITHYFGTGVLLYTLGVIIGIEWLEYAGLIQLAHVNFDRAMGYGLKYPGSFRKTHLGLIGKEKPTL